MSWWWLPPIHLMHAFPKRLWPPVKVWWRHCENYCPAHKSEPGTISLQISQTITIPVGETDKKTNLEADPSIRKTNRVDRVGQLKVVQIGSLVGTPYQASQFIMSLYLYLSLCVFCHCYCYVDTAVSWTKSSVGRVGQLELVQIGSLPGRPVPLTMIDTSLSLARFQCQILHLKPSGSTTSHNLKQVN